jgi:outer membrane protein insertion porin family
VDLVLEINEGAKTGIKRIAFVGNRAFLASRLKAVITTTESGWFAFLKTSDVYDPDHIELDADLLQRFYLKNGFADHLGGRTTLRSAQQGVTQPSLDEGELSVRAHRHRLAQPMLDSAALRSIPRFGPGDVFDGEAVGRPSTRL